ncbi:MAG: DUF669 domain-containing protein [Anaerovoracaceae bacterium]
MENENKIPQGFEEVKAGEMEAFEDHEFDWDSEIENDGAGFILLAEGDYDFEVASFERGRFAGSDKMPACNQANLFLKVKGKDLETGKEGEATIRHRLLLHTKTEWTLCEFFAGIGQRKKGEKLKMNWNLVVGSHGKAKVGIREYNGKKYNEIKKFYEPSEPPKQQQTSFNPGEF